ncbi:MAG: hypothetical protein V3W05_02280 [candidate division NC10 bacterium]
MKLETSWGKDWTKQKPWRSHYNRIIDFTGFAGFITAAIWDWRLEKFEEPTRSAPDVAKQRHVQQKEGGR